MHSNRRRHANIIPIMSLVTWGLVGIFACVGGLGWVWCKNQLYTTGTEIKSLERELTDLKDRNEAVLTKIAQLSSTAKLRERYDNGFIKLVPITNDHITMLNNTAPPTRTGDLRPAANERTHE